MPFSPAKLSFAIAAVSLLGVAALRPAAAQTEDAAVPAAASGTTLDLTLDTGSSPASSPAAASAPASSKPAPNNLRVIGGPLASRSAGVSREVYRATGRKAPSVLAQLGTVTAARAELRAERVSSSRLLSVAPQGTNLAVVADGGTHWGVLMIDGTMGWAAKSAVRLVDYQTEVPVPTDPSTARPSTAAGSAAGLLSGLPEDLDGRTQALLREAFTYLGVPYVWAGNTRAGLDCSAFVKNVFGSQGYKLPRHSGDQAKVGTLIRNGADIRAGDRLYFDMGNKGRVSHCGIYLGNGMFIHASTNRKSVGVDSIFKPNYYKALVCVRRS